MRKTVIPKPMVVEALSWCSRRTSQYPAVQNPVHPRKTSPGDLPVCRSALARGQRSASPPETSLLARLTSVHKGSVFPLLVKYRDSLFPCQHTLDRAAAPYQASHTFSSASRVPSPFGRGARCEYHPQPAKLPPSLNRPAEWRTLLGVNLDPSPLILQNQISKGDGAR